MVWSVILLNVEFCFINHACTTHIHTPHIISEKSSIFYEGGKSHCIQVVKKKVFFSKAWENDVGVASTCKRINSYCAWAMKVYIKLPSISLLPVGRGFVGV